jgi:hypothetical protein
MPEKFGFEVASRVYLVSYMEQTEGTEVLAFVYSDE